MAGTAGDLDSVSDTSGTVLPAGQSSDGVSSQRDAPEECVSQPVDAAVLALVPSVSIRVFVDGSTDDFQGFAAGCLIAGVDNASRASLALPGMTGAEVSELLGIIFGLMKCFQFRHSYTMFVLMVDSKNAIKHVFGMLDPVGRRGQDLWPAIALARLLVCRLEYEH